MKDRLWDIGSLVLPLIAMAQFWALKYVTIKEKYMELMAETNPNYKQSKQYIRYKKYQNIMNVMKFKNER